MLHNTLGLTLLAVFEVIGVVAVGIATALNSNATLKCNPRETVSSDVAKKHLN